MTGRTLKCDFCNAKSQFYRAFNAVYSKVGRAASEECVLALLQAKCLPILLYGTEACPLVSRDRQSFEFTVNQRRNFTLKSGGDRGRGHIASAWSASL